MTASPPPSDLVTLTINGREVKVPKGTLVVEAAKTVGIEIPVFCYHPKLKPYGACRMCLVEIEKVPRMQTACTSPVAEGNVIHTNNANVIAAQNGVEIATFGHAGDGNMHPTIVYDPGDAEHTPHVAKGMVSDFTVK